MKKIIFQNSNVIMYEGDKPFIPRGEYVKTSVDEAKEKADILIEACNEGTYTLDTKGIDISGRGVKCRYQNGCYEVTESYLNKLRASYNVITNF